MAKIVNKLTVLETRFNTCSIYVLWLGLYGLDDCLGFLISGILHFHNDISYHYCLMITLAMTILTIVVA